MQNFKYSLIRYIPNPMRGEMVNIGIVVFTPNLDVRLLKSTSKFRMLDNETTISDINKFEKTFHKIGDKVDSPESFVKRLSCFTSSVIVSAPATFSISHSSQYESKVSNLFNTLVKPFATREKVARNSRLVTNLKKKFASIEILASDASQLNEHKIVSNYVLNESNGISADFLLKNGKYHLTEVIDYDVVDKRSKFKETTMKLMTFVEGQKSLDGELASYFVYSASTSTEREVAQQINLAEDYSTKIFNLASRNDEAEYFQIIQDAVGQQLPFVH